MFPFPGNDQYDDHCKCGNILHQECNTYIPKTFSLIRSIKRKQCKEYDHDDQKYTQSPAQVMISGIWSSPNITFKLVIKVKNTTKTAKCQGDSLIPRFAPAGMSWLYLTKAFKCTIFTILFTIIDGLLLPATLLTIVLTLVSI